MLVATANEKTRADRLEAAKARIQALEPIVSRLTIEVAPQEPHAEIEVRLNGQRVAAEQLGTALSVDGGSVLITAASPGLARFESEVRISPQGARETVRIPKLASDVPARRVQDIPVVRPLGLQKRQSMPPSPSEPHRSWLMWGGAASITAGLTALTVGGMLSLRRVHDNNVRNSGCTRQACVEDPEQQPLELKALDKTLLIGGSVLTVAGVSLMVWERRARAESPQAQARLTGWWLPSAGGAVVSGDF